MKSLSASIVVLAGVVCFAGGAFIRHGDTQLFVCGVGLVVIVAGLAGWFVSLRATDQQPL